MPFIQQIRRREFDEECAYLLRHAGNLTSQFGEDGILTKVLNTVGPKNAWCVEFGAWDGKTYSNTYNLIKNNFWNGVLIEGSPERFLELEETYRGSPQAHLKCCMVGFDPDRDSIECILQSTDIPKDFDLISIDIDGNDWFIWESMTRYRPRVVVIEFNPTVPNDVVFVQDRDFRINQGCSLRALVELGRLKGYELVCATFCNGIFVVKEEYGKFGIRDNSIDRMYEPIAEGRIFHGYDGTIYNIGFDRLLWHGTAVAPDSLQILPAKERVFMDHLPREKTTGQESAP